MSIVCVTYSSPFSVTQTRPGTGEKGQAAKSLKFDLYRVLAEGEKLPAKLNRLKAIFTGQTEAKDKSQVG